MFKQIATAFKSLASSTEANPKHFRNLMAPGKIGVVSSQCCNPSAHIADKELIELVEQCMRDSSTYLDVNLETITAAQKGIGKLGTQVDEEEQAIIDLIGGLFQKGGVKIFPILIVDRKLVSYGGSPTAEIITTALAAVDRQYLKDAPEAEDDISIGGLATS